MLHVNYINRDWDERCRKQNLSSKSSFFILYPLCSAVLCVLNVLYHFM